MEYAIIDKLPWKTNLCKCECESCFLSCIVPCHVYSKIISKTSLEYTTHIILYIILYSLMHQLLYFQYTMNNNICPSTEIQNCLTADSCLKYYMIVNSIPLPCRYVDDLCVYDEYQCIQPHEYSKLTKTTLLLTTFLYSIINYMHYQARKFMQQHKNIGNSTCIDCYAVTLCSSCGLAQAYRELEL